MKLDLYLQENQITDSDFAKAIKVQPTTVYRYRKGLRIPDRDIMPRIIEATESQVTANDFFENQTAPEPPEAA